MIIGETSGFYSTRETIVSKILDSQLLIYKNRVYAALREAYVYWAFPYQFSEILVSTGFIGHKRGIFSRKSPHLESVLASSSAIFGRICSRKHKITSKSGAKS